MESYIEDKKNLCTTILNFLGESDENNDEESMNESFEEIIEDHQKERDAEEMHQFLEIVKSIGEHSSPRSTFQRANEPTSITLQRPNQTILAYLQALLDHTIPLYVLRHKK